MTSSRHILSKSTFMRGLQCPKSLYLNKFHSELRDKLDVSQEAIFRTGKVVGELACGLFPGGVNARPLDPFHYQESVQLTQKFITEGTEVIYEAAFQYNQVLAVVDILVRAGGRWKAFEVKSSTSVKEPFLWDVALQYYVITGYDLELEDFCIAHINNQYVRRGELDLQQLFLLVSVITQAQELQPQVEEKVFENKVVLASNEIPEIDIGPYCSDPYDCDFTGHCWSHIPEDSIFTVAKLGKKKKFELYDSGAIRIEDIPGSFPLNRTSKSHVDCHVHHRSIIEKDRIRSFLQSLDYPLYFLDFETINPAIPPFDNTRPYQAIPYQYSLHIKPSPTSDLDHTGFLADAGTDSRQPLIEALLRDAGSSGSILVYSLSFEATRIKELAEQFPEYATDLMALSSRLKDLMLPFQKRYYYTPEMRGSYSIKAVLPALVPDMKYGDLEISDGMQAMEAFRKLEDENDPQRVAEIRDALWEYCKLDTLAMVRILEKLESI